MENSKKSTQIVESPLETYLSLLAGKGAVEGNLIRRRTFLTMLLKELQNHPASEKVYGALVEDKLRSFGQEELRHFFQVTAREFYWFWVGDAARVAAFKSGAEKISVNPFRLHLVNTLEELQSQADAHFNSTPHPALDTYKEKLGADEKKTNPRLSVARMVLYAFRDFDQHSDMFRAAVSAIADKYTNTVGRESFLFIIREFYPIWLDTCNVDI